MLVFGCLPTTLILTLGFAMQAQDDDRNGFIDAARTKAKASLGLNIAAVVVIVLTWILMTGGLTLNFLLVGVASVASEQ